MEIQPKEAPNVDTSIQPDEDAFFKDLVTKVGSTKLSFDSMYDIEGDFSEGADTPGILPLCRRDFDDSAKTHMNQDLPSRSQGLGANAIHDAGAFEDVAKDINNAVSQAQGASTALQQLQAGGSQSVPPPGSAAPTTAPPQTTSVTTVSGAPQPAATPQTPTTSTPTPVAPVAPTSVPKPQPTPIPPPGPKPTSITYGSPAPAPKTSSLNFDPNAYSARSMSERAHTAWFQSNPFMQFNQPSPLNPAGQFNDMNYNPRPSYFEEGTGDSSFSNLHTPNNGCYSRDSLNFGGVTDLLVVRPADPRWVDESPDLAEMLPMTSDATADPKLASLSSQIDLKMAKMLSTEDNPYIRDYSEVRPLNADLDFSVNKPERDPNDPQNPEDVGDSLHQQPNPRYRAIGGGGDAGGHGDQFDPNQSTADPFIDVTSPGSADGHSFTMPSYKTKRPVSDLPMGEFFKDH